jgi:hypothetical protein
MSGLALAGCAPTPSERPRAPVSVSPIKTLDDAVKHATQDAARMKNPPSPHPVQTIPRLRGPMPVARPLSAEEQAARQAMLKPRRPLPAAPKRVKTKRTKEYLGMVLGGEHISF